MPLLKFEGGPWDGVEFEAPTAPDALNMRDLVIDGNTDPDSGKATLTFYGPLEHNVYLRQLESGEDVQDVYVYDYRKDGKPWWEGIVKAPE
ncbi:MAG: hypothetical protein WDZ51_03445 [Pirellulaceae bacterium]